MSSQCVHNTDTLQVCVCEYCKRFLKNGDFQLSLFIMSPSLTVLPHRMGVRAGSQLRIRRQAPRGASSQPAYAMFGGRETGREGPQSLLSASPLCTSSAGIKGWRPSEPGRTTYLVACQALKSSWCYSEGSEKSCTKETCLLLTHHF